jgi:hypothetical protein
VKNFFEVSESNVKFWNMGIALGVMMYVYQLTQHPHPTHKQKDKDIPHTIRTKDFGIRYSGLPLKGLVI